MKMKMRTAICWAVNQTTAAAAAAAGVNIRRYTPTVYLTSTFTASKDSTDHPRRHYDGQ